MCIYCTPLRAIFQPEASGFSLIPDSMVLAFQFLVLFCGLPALSVFLANFHKMELVAVYKWIGGVLKFDWSQVGSTLLNLQQVLVLGVCSVFLVSFTFYCWRAVKRGKR